MKSTILILFSAGLLFGQVTATRSTIIDDMGARGNWSWYGDTHKPTGWGLGGTWTYNGASKSGSIYSSMNDGGWSYHAGYGSYGGNAFITTITDLDFTTPTNDFENITN